MRFLLVFIAAAGIDAAYTYWVNSVSRGFRWRAALWSMIIGALNVVGISQLLYGGIWYSIPWVIGLGAGTALAVSPSSPKREAYDGR